MKLTALLFLLVVVNKASSLYLAPRATLIPGQACSFQPYNKLLTCSCGGKISERHELTLELQLFIRDQGQEVREVKVDSCSDLFISLDLRGVNPTDIPFRFKNIGDLRFESIQFEQHYSGQQRLDIQLEHVTRVFLEDIRVDEALQLTAKKVKEVVVRRSHFEHIPLPGMVLTQTDRLTVENSVFKRIAAQAISVDTTIRNLKVVNNEFNINAVKVVKTTAGDHLYISCNRLLGQPSSPECVSMAAPPPSPSPVPISTSPPQPALSPPSPSPPLPERRSSLVSLELVIGIVAGVGGVLLLLLLTLILICCRRRKEKEREKVKEDKEEGDTATVVDNDSGNNTAESCSDCEERKSLLTPLENKEEEEEEKVVDEEAGLVEAQKPKFRSPLWLEDIHTNRLFNKQKSILTEETLPPPPPPAEILETTPHRPERPFPVRSISEVIDSADEEELPPPPQEQMLANVRKGLPMATETDL